MGFLDKLKGMASQNEEKVEKGVDTGARKLDERTGHKHSDKIRKGTDQAKKRLHDQTGGSGSPGGSGGRGGTGGTRGQDR